MRAAFRLALCAATGVMAGTVSAASGASTSAPILGPGLVHLTVDIEHSRFDLDELRVRPGTTVEFVVRNGDPINHEFVIGPETVHVAHRRGTDLVHPPLPGEVSVGPAEAGLTYYRFDEAGTVTFACHLPGHEAYGMAGAVEVVADD